MQSEFRRRASASNAQMWQDKLLELFDTQSCRNALPLLTFRHFDPQKNWEFRLARSIAQKHNASKGLRLTSRGPKNPQPVARRNDSESSEPLAGRLGAPAQRRHRV